MTAAEALASMREDIDRLEAKGWKPGHIARRRAEVQAIERELASLNRQVDEAEFATADAIRERKDSDQRVGMLANVLEITGIGCRVHMARPVTDADIYYHAAKRVYEIEKEKGLLNVLPWQRTWQDMKARLHSSLEEARVTLYLQRIEQLIAKTPTTNASKEEEQKVAA